MHEYACAFVHLSMHVYPPHKYIHILGIKPNQRGKNDIYQKLQNTDERTPKEGLSIFIDYESVGLKAYRFYPFSTLIM